MELRYGGGQKDAVVVLGNSEVRVYRYGEDTDSLHASVGGRQYYRSRSGASGAGHIPDLPQVRRVSTYRTDTSSLVLPEPEECLGHRIAVPFDYRSRDLGTYPVLVKTWQAGVTCSDNVIGGWWCVAEHQLARLLAFELRENCLADGPGDWQSFNFGFWMGGAERTLTVRLLVWDSCFSQEVLRRIAKAIALPHMVTPLADCDATTPESAWWERLGLIQSGEHVYRLTVDGVLILRYPVAVLQDLDTLRTIIRPTCVLESLDSCIWRGVRYSRDGNEEHLSVDDLAKALIITPLPRIDQEARHEQPTSKEDER